MRNDRNHAGWDMLTDRLGERPDGRVTATADVPWLAARRQQGPSPGGVSILVDILDSAQVAARVGLEATDDGFSYVLDLDRDGDIDEDDLRLEVERTGAAAVANTLDSGSGSSRAAIEHVNALAEDGRAAIIFRIPATDPGFLDVDAHLPGGDPSPDACVISPRAALPPLTRGNILIFGPSQQTVTGATNPFAPEIVPAGNLATGANPADGRVNGLELRSSGNVVDGLNIQGEPP